MQFDDRLATAAPTVAIVDSGIDLAQIGNSPLVAGAVRFVVSGDARRPGMQLLPPLPDPVGHGTDVARLILAAAPGASLLSAQVFADRRPVSADAVAAGILWGVAQGAQLINLSLGLREDRWALRHACAAAQAAGVLLVASSPARGGPVFPAAYPGVLAVTGDARCAPGEWSLIEPPPSGRSPADGVLVGICPNGPATGVRQGAPRLATAGASFAAARLCGVAAAWWACQASGAASAAAFLDYLDAGAAHRGRERYPKEHAA